MGPVYVGVGGWDFAPWRETFYPPGLRKADWLAHMAARLTMTEVNATFYRTQTPNTFASWAAATPRDFRFALKAPRYIVGAKRLGETGERIGFFLASGFGRALGGKLGPILWQFADTKRFDEDDAAAFFALLPREADGVPLQHALEPRHASWDTPAFHALAAAHGCAVVQADSNDYPVIGTGTGPFAYIRAQRTRPELVQGYPEGELDALTAEARAQAADGGTVHLLVIAGAKDRNPAAAEVLIRRLR
jgi:uncharacterized protein YecE (DUF72 family)